MSKLICINARACDSSMCEHKTPHIEMWSCKVFEGCDYSNRNNTKCILIKQLGDNYER